MESRSTPPPASIGRFRVDELIGSGGMGEVYKAFDPTLQRTVAIKTVRPDIVASEHLERLFREAQACARLRHPNVVTVYEAGEIAGVVYIAMEYLVGEDLAAVLRRGELTFEAKVRILIQILEALHHAHAADVIHRDIKPHNVFCLPDGSVKLVDFGLARMLRAETLTATGAIMGTPHYASPEQLKGEPTDRRTDIYSTGALAYEMFTGRHPFGSDNDTLAKLVLRVISEPPPPMNVRFPEIERIVFRAMAKSPADRHQSAEEMRDALTAFLASSRDALAADAKTDRLESSAATRSRVASPPAASSLLLSRRSWWLGGIAAAILVAAAIMIPQRRAATLDPAAPSMDRTPASAAPADARQGVTGDRNAGTRANQGATSARSPEIQTAGAVGSGSPGSGAAVQSSPAPADASRVIDALADVSAKQLFAGGAGSPAAGMNTGLRYRLIRQSAEGAEIDVDPSTATFRSGDRVRFIFESNIDGSLYVVQQGSSGRWTVLFPSPQINGGRNAIRRAEQYQVPPDGWFAFDATPGSEQVFVFLGREPLRQLPGFDRPLTRPETVASSVVDELQHQIRPRDLVFEKDRARATQAGAPMQVMYVVNRAEVGRAVAASISLTHIP